MVERTASETGPFADTIRLPTGPGTLTGLRSKMAEGGTTRKPCPKAPTGFEPATAP